MRNFIHDNYGISRNRYRELAAFCLQYEEWKRALAECYSLKGAIPHAVRSGGINDPTSHSAIQAEAYQKNIDLIEETAREAYREIAPQLIKAVTQEISYERLDVPVGRRQFYNARRKFFYLLDKKRS